MNPQLHLAADYAAEEIENYIHIYQLRPHDRLPSEREMACLFHVNRITLREAIHRLENEHVLYSIIGSGTYVAPAKLRTSMGINFSFSSYCAANDYKASNKVLAFRKTEASQYLCARLNISEHAEIYILKRLRYLNGKPAAIETSHIPAAICPDLDQFRLDENSSLYEILTREYGLFPQNSGYQISMALADSESAFHLNVADGAPLLSFDVLSSVSDHRIIEYCQTLRRIDLFGLSSDIQPAV